MTNAPNLMVNGLPIAHNSSQKIIPTTGQSISLIANGLSTSITIEPAGSLSALTISIDDGVADGQIVNLSFYQLVSTLTISGNNIDTSGITYGPAIGPKEAIIFVWSQPGSKWKAIIHSSGQ